MKQAPLRMPDNGDAGSEMTGDMMSGNPAKRVRTATRGRKCLFLTASRAPLGDP